MRESLIQSGLDAERDLLLAEIVSMGQAGGVPTRLLPSADRIGEQVRVQMERGRRLYSLCLEDRGVSTILSAQTADAFLEEVFRHATSKLATEQAPVTAEPGQSPSGAWFTRWVELLSRVQPEWAERLERRRGELLGLPGSLKL